MKSKDRFVVCLRNLFKNELIVTDKDLKFHVGISQSQLEDKTFDLIGWYLNVLRERDQRVVKGTAGECILHQAGQHLFIGCSQLEAEPRDNDIVDQKEDHTYDDLPELYPLSDDEESDDEEEEDYKVNSPTSSDNDESESDSANYADLPRLVPIDEEDDPVDGYVSEGIHEIPNPGDISEDDLMTRLTEVLTICQPFPGDGEPQDESFSDGDNRFVIARQSSLVLEIYDRVQGFLAPIAITHLRSSTFMPGLWFAERCASNQRVSNPWKTAHEWVNSNLNSRTMMWMSDFNDRTEFFTREMTPADALDLSGVQVDRNKYPTLQRNSAQIKGNHRILPKPDVVKVEVNNHPVRALLDSGSLGDFISSTLVDQLSIKREKLDTPLSLHLAVQGSRSKVNARANVNLKYQGIEENRTLDIINLNNYDLILGTPWMYQHQVCLGFNPARVMIGSNDSLPLKVGADTKMMVSMLAPEDKDVEAVRERLCQCADPICREVNETDLPPFRAINHKIPLIYETKIYPWRPSRCPEVFRTQWAEKRDAYLKSGRREITSSGNTVPMLLISKLNTNPPVLRTVVDLCKRNKNTHRMTSPLPDMEGVLRRTAKHKYRTTLDMKNAYEQIRVVPEHVSRTTVTTPDGNMISNVVQIGDCNAPATYQALMNFLFSAYIGRFLDIYLDDIVIYSDSLEEHEAHVRLVLDILKREKLYLSRSKLHFIQPVLKLLGRVIDDEGIQMDQDKVDSVLNWKVPTNRDLLRGFIGLVGYLADDIPNVRMPLGILSSITGDTVPFRWGYTEQRAFDEVKALVHTARNHHRVPLDYSPAAPPVWMITDGSATGISGVVCQGPEWKKAKIAAFYSAKLNSAQQNYAVHEIELLAGIETMLRYADILQGVQFQWLTDHKGLTHLLNQKICRVVKPDGLRR